MSNNTDNLKIDPKHFQKTDCYQKSRFIPMLFSTPMVQAILEGKKTQTRRLIKYKKEIKNPQIGFSAFTDNGAKFEVRGEHLNGRYGGSIFKAPIQEGDIIWARETFNTNYNDTGFIYKADYKEPAKNKQFWKPSLFMPKEASRIWLKVTKVRIEKLCHITEEDSIAEGIERVPLAPFIVRYKDYMEIEEYLESPIESYGSLWDKINGTGSYNSNPYVWVYEFERLNERPSDF